MRGIVNFIGKWASALFISLWCVILVGFITTVGLAILSIVALLFSSWIFVITLIKSVTMPRKFIASPFGKLKDALGVEIEPSKVPGESKFLIRVVTHKTSTTTTTHSEEV